MEIGWDFQITFSVCDVSQHSENWAGKETFFHDIEITFRVTHLFADFAHINPGFENSFNGGCKDKIFSANGEMAKIANKNGSIASNNAEIGGEFPCTIVVEPGNISEWVPGNHPGLDCVQWVDQHVDCSGETQSGYQLMQEFSLLLN